MIRQKWCIVQLTPKNLIRFPNVGAGGWQTTEKSTIKRECLMLRHEHSLFEYYEIMGLVRDNLEE